MAAFTSKAAGNWSSGGQTTWNEVGVPGTGDTVTITHAITVDVNTTISGITSFSATLTVANSVTFTIKGAVTQGNANFVLGLGSHVIFDTTAASFVWTMGTASSQANCKMVWTGSSGSPWIVEKTGGNYFYFDEPGAGGGGTSDTTAWDVQYGTIKKIRNSSSTTGIRQNSFGSAIFRFRNITFDETLVGPFVFDHDATQPVQFDDAKWINTPSGKTPLDFKINNPSPGSRISRCLRCAFDEKPRMGKGIGFTWESCFFSRFINPEGAFTTGSFIKNFLCARTGDNEFVPNIGIADNFLLQDQTVGNPHFLAGSNGVSDLIFERLIFDWPFPLTFDTGDCILGYDLTYLIVRYCLVVPSESDGITPGFLGNQGSNSATPVNAHFHHNTVCGKQALVAYVKDYGASGPVFSELKSNIAYSPTAGDFLDTPPGCAIVYDLHDTTSPYDVATGSGCTHNAIYHGIPYTDPSNGSASYTGYHQHFPTSGTPGSNDKLVDPQFVDYGRNFCKWVVYKGAASGGDTVRQKLDAGYALLAADPTLTYTDLIPWVRAGYAPQNATLKDAGHDAITIGAVEFASTGQPAARRRRRTAYGLKGAGVY